MKGRPRIGARGRRFTLELPNETPDGFGGVLRSYAPGPRAWGTIEFIAARERVAAGRTEASATHRVTLPFRADLSPHARLSLGIRRFRIVSADDPDGCRARLVCLVEEIAA